MVYKEICRGLDQDCIESIDQLGKNGHINNIEVFQPKNTKNTISLFIFSPLSICQCSFQYTSLIHLLSGLSKSISFCFFFLGLHPRHMEVPRLGVESEIQLPAYTTARATRFLSHVCDLHHSLRQPWIPDPPSEARDSNPHPHGYQSDSFPLSHSGNSLFLLI